MTKKKTGRPLNHIDWDLVEKLCQLHATGEEIAGVLSISYDSLVEAVKRLHGISFPEYFKQKSAAGKVSLRRRQYSSAMEGNPTLLIWLGKNWLGQTDAIELTGSNDKPIMLSYKLPDETEGE